jgi:DNA transformation protein
MSASAFERFVLDQLADLGAVRSRRMFGGAGLYRDDVFFGLIARDELYLKVNEQTRREYEAAGMRPFKPYPARPTTMKYYSVPVGVLESAPDLVSWARKALAVAQSAGERTTGRRSRSVSHEK